MINHLIYFILALEAAGAEGCLRVLSMESHIVVQQKEKISNDAPNRSDTERKETFFKHKNRHDRLLHKVSLSCIRNEKL